MPIVIIILQIQEMIIIVINNNILCDIVKIWKVNKINNRIVIIKTINILV